MSARVTTAGVEIQTRSEVAEETKAKLRLKPGFSGTFNLEPESPVGELIDALSEREADLQALILEVARGKDPATAGGAFLDMVLALTGTKRLAAKPSTAPGRCHGVNGTVLDPSAGDVVIQLDATGENWRLTGGPYTIPVGGSVDVAVESVDTGAKQAATTGQAGWTIQTPVSGWTGFESTADATLGRDSEEPGPARLRRLQEVAGAGKASTEAISADVSQVSGVSYVRTYSNRKLVTDADGLPGKSVNVVVEGGADADIAKAIFESVSGGIETHGAVSVQHVDSHGNAHTIKFDRVADVLLWVTVTVTTSTSETVYPANGDALIETAILEYGAALQPGEDALPSAMEFAAKSLKLTGVDDVQVTIVGDDGSGPPPASGAPSGAYVRAKTSIAIRNRGKLSSDRVAVVQV